MDLDGRHFICLVAGDPDPVALIPPIDVPVVVVVVKAHVPLHALLPELGPQIIRPPDLKTEHEPFVEQAQS